MVQELEKLTHGEPGFGVTLADYFLGLHRHWDHTADPLVPLEAFHHQRDGVFHYLRIHSHAQEWTAVNLGKQDADQQVSASLHGSAPSPALGPLARVALESFVLKYPGQLLTALANRVQLSLLPDYCIEEDFMKAVRKVADAKKLETTIDYSKV